MTKKYTSLEPILTNRPQALTKSYCYTVALEQIHRAAQLEAERDEARRKLEQAQERIAELETLLFGKAVTMYEAQS